MHGPIARTGACAVRSPPSPPSTSLLSRFHPHLSHMPGKPLTPHPSPARGPLPAGREFPGDGTGRRGMQHIPARAPPPRFPAPEWGPQPVVGAGCQVLAPVGLKFGVSRIAVVSPTCCRCWGMHQGLAEMGAPGHPAEGPYPGGRWHGCRLTPPPASALSAGGTPGHQQAAGRSAAPAILLQPVRPAPAVPAEPEGPAPAHAVPPAASTAPRPAGTARGATGAAERGHTASVCPPVPA